MGGRVTAVTLGLELGRCLLTAAGLSGQGSATKGLVWGRGAVDREAWRRAPALPFPSRPLSSLKGPALAAISIPGNPQAICDQREP